MSGHGTAASDPRPPTQREREILDFLLSPDSPGVAELREQAKTALVRTWDWRRLLRHCFVRVRRSTHPLGKELLPSGSIP
jgi:hypothetical protein